jgi:meso-butanediol dehydrogenase / (S,S)-butanediol dehydrogenase / diacetyl reductase
LDQERRPVVIVTGAASGIGRATVESMRANDWRVVAVDRVVAPLGDLIGEELRAVEADITTEEGNAAGVSAAVDTFGGLDAVVLNAGIHRAGPIDQMPLTDVMELISVNVLGPILGIRAALPVLRKSGRGSIVVTSSIGGLQGTAYTSAYAATKAASISLVKSVALEVGRDGVRINAVCPGPTAGTAISAAATSNDRLRAYMADTIALKRWGTPTEIAAAIEFLASDRASFVTGTTLVVDGGLTAGRSWVTLDS